jgi:hypothetical protein
MTGLILLNQRYYFTFVTEALFTLQQYDNFSLAKYRDFLIFAIRGKPEKIHAFK